MQKAKHLLEGKSRDYQYEYQESGINRDVVRDE